MSIYLLAILKILILFHVRLIRNDIIKIRMHINETTELNTEYSELKLIMPLLAVVFKFDSNANLCRSMGFEQLKICLIHKTNLYCIY